MFDDKQPEDIFDGMDKSKVDGRVDSATPSTPSPVPAQENVPVPRPVERPVVVPEPVHHGGGSIWKTLIVVLLAFIAIATAAYLTYVFMAKPPASTNVISEEENEGGDLKNENTNPLSSGEEEPAVQEEPKVDKDTVTDSDGDGLTNAVELEVGTSISKPDTDSDGLGDREEVQVYGTDPLRTDTDEDGFLDGQEVQAGYNPNGPGKLLEIPATEEE